MEIFVEFGSLFSFIYTITLPNSLFGGHVFVLCMCFSHLSDMTSTRERTTRILIANAITLSSIPIGVLFGNLLYYKVFDLSYPAMFFVNTVFIAFSIIWTLWRVNDVPRENAPCAIAEKPYSCIQGFINHYVDSHVFAKFLLLFSMLFFYELQHNEKLYSYLYTQLVFGWSASDFSYFRGLQTTLFVFVTLMMSFITSRAKELNCEGKIIIFSAVCHIAAGITYFCASSEWLFYLGAIVGASGVLTPSILRSMISKLVSVQNTGKIFSLIFLCENIAPLLGVMAYSQLYNQLAEIEPGAFFIFTVVTQTILLVLGGLLIKWFYCNK